MQAIDFVKEQCQKEGYENDLYDFLSDLETIYKEEDNGSHRWWNDCFCVAKIEDKFIGWMSARTTGDDSPYDKGWEFDPSSICYVEPYEIKCTKYRII